MADDYTLVSLARHRNGISGEPFHVVIFDSEDGRMVATVFDAAGHVAVLNVAQTAAENIAFAQGNSWRGDRYEGWLRRTIQDDKDRAVRAEEDRIESGQSRWAETGSTRK